MTNNELLLAVQTWLGTLTDGYTIRYGRHSLSDIADELPLMQFRDAGNGIINSNIKEKIVRIIVYIPNSQWQNSDTRLGEIAVKAGNPDENPPNGTIKLRLLSDVKGPFNEPDENQMLYLDLMVTL